MYKTLSITSVIMILSFSGYISEDARSHVTVSVEINFPDNNVEERVNTKEILDFEIQDSKQFIESEERINKVSVPPLVPSSNREQKIIDSYIDKYQSPINLIASHDKSFGTVEELKPLIQNYFIVLGDEKKIELAKLLQERQKLFWQHDKYTENGGRIRGIYLNGYLYGNETFRESMHSLIRSTTINTVVIDVKSDNGHILYETNIKEALDINAVRKKYGKEHLAYYKKNNIYLIGRLVAFQDPLYAKNYEESAVWDTRVSQPYKQGGQYFLDPSDEDARQYVLDIAVEACRLGFNEIQFDYIRYPDTNYRFMKFDLESTIENRIETIQSFLLQAQKKLHKEGCLVSADVFGFTLTNKLDGGIGQNFESIIGSVDFVSPMIYPSHYSRGSFGYTSPNSHPYEVVSAALNDALDRIESRYPLRPYLQGFWHTEEEIRQGIRAAEDKNLSWILWNSISNYSKDLFKVGNDEQ